MLIVHPVNLLCHLPLYTTGAANNVYSGILRPYPRRASQLLVLILDH